jgi:hypothetical protein
MYTEGKDEAGNYPVRMIPKGTYFRRVKADGTAFGPVYIRGEYDRGLRSYSCDKADDISEGVYLRGTRLVNVGFDY